VISPRVGQNLHHDGRFLPEFRACELFGEDSNVRRERRAKAAKRPLGRPLDGGLGRIAP
jgi:hypothetical protein